MSNFPEATGLWRKGVTDSEYLASEDFEPGAKPVVLTIKRVVQGEPINPSSNKKQQKYCLEFEKTDKLLVLNATRGRAIARMAGSNRVEKWAGLTIGLEHGTTLAFGKTVGCIVVTAPE